MVIFLFVHPKTLASQNFQNQTTLKISTAQKTFKVCPLSAKISATKINAAVFRVYMKSSFHGTIEIVKYSK